MAEKMNLDIESARGPGWDEIPAKNIRIYGYTVDEAAQIIGSLRQMKLETVRAFVDGVDRRFLGKTPDCPEDQGAELHEAIEEELEAWEKRYGSSGPSPSIST